MFKRYKNPDDVGWLGWFEDFDGNCIAFVSLDRKIIFSYELGSDYIEYD